MNPQRWMLTLEGGVEVWVTSNKPPRFKFYSIQRERVSEPLVAAIMLTKDRPVMARRAVECFRAQTYERKRMVIVNSGEDQVSLEDQMIWEPVFTGIDRMSIGFLRNHANKFASAHYGPSDMRPDVFVHWDDDDWSHSNRIAEQVALLQSSGADCVGYRSLLCWREKECAFCADPEGVAGAHCSCGDGQAWRYSHPSPSYALGASLCYWRKTWEQRPFQDISKGEDSKFIEGLRMVTDHGEGERNGDISLVEPSMIIGMHGGNTCNTTDPAAEAARGSDQWARVPEWDAYCRERMAP